MEHQALRQDPEPHWRQVSGVFVVPVAERAADMLALACASIALVPGYSRGGPSRPSLSTSVSRPSLRRSAVVRLALDPAGADSADAPAPEPAQQEAWPEPAFSVAELQAKEQERIEAAEAAAREAAVPLTTEDGAFSVVALVTVLFCVESKVALASASWLSGSPLQFGQPGLIGRLAGRTHRPCFRQNPTLTLQLKPSILPSPCPRCWSSSWAASCSSRPSRAPG